MAKFKNKISAKVKNAPGFKPRACHTHRRGIYTVDVGSGIPATPTCVTTTPHTLDFHSKFSFLRWLMLYDQTTCEFQK